MKEGDLGAEWAWTQVEAWADGSLTPESRARMAAAMAADPRLSAAAERAVAVHRALRATEAPPPMPRGLRRRLLAIPGRTASARSFALPAFASAAAAVVVVAAAVWLRPQPPPQPDPRAVAAAQELEVAMRYLQKSARATQGQVTSVVGSGLRDAFAATREALEKEDETGG